MKKKIVTMMIAGILAASMTACSNNSSEMDSLKKRKQGIKSANSRIREKSAARRNFGFLRFRP